MLAIALAHVSESESHYESVHTHHTHSFFTHLHVLIMLNEYFQNTMFDDVIFGMTSQNLAGFKDTMGLAVQ